MRPEIVRSNVVFPAPLAPMSATMDLLGRDKRYAAQNLPDRHSRTRDRKLQERVPEFFPK